ncbi:transporter substrate-binding domain-containing protein [Desulfobacterales bacterium HSG17]|nr:transporter substrate-binding domain-containing protein [Desulfobacterales bacterium HSG17]
MKKFGITLLLLVLISFPASGLAEKLIFATSEWPPYVTLKDGQPTGIMMDVVRELCKRLRIEEEIRVVPWKRALSYAKNGKADAIFSVRYTEERSKFIYYLAEYMIEEKTVILAQKGSGIRITKLDDLKDKTIGVVRGYTYGTKFDKYQGLRKIINDNDEQLINNFAKGRITMAVSADEGVTRYLCKQIGVETEVAYVIENTHSYIGFSKAKGEKGKAMADKFSKTLKQLRIEGFIEKTLNKYF